MEVRFEQLTKRYGDKVVLDVEQGQLGSGTITGIIGPNGAGKTTLLNIIAGLDTPDTGKVLYQQEGSDAMGLFTEKVPLRAVTMLFQTPYMLHTTVEKNVAYPLRLRHIERDVINRRVDNLLKELDLTSLAKNKAWKLSGGETQKLALARAIALRPRLLLLDEPTSNIDNIHVAVIEKVLANERSKHHTTIAIISHNLAQIRRLCNNVIFMEKGRIVEHGSAEHMLTSPKDPRTQAFIAGELLL